MALKDVLDLLRKPEEPREYLFGPQLRAFRNAKSRGSNSTETAAQVIVNLARMTDSDPQVFDARWRVRYPFVRFEGRKRQEFYALPSFVPGELRDVVYQLTEAIRWLQQRYEFAPVDQANLTALSTVLSYAISQYDELCKQKDGKPHQPNGSAKQ